MRYGWHSRHQQPATAKGPLAIEPLLRFAMMRVSS